MTSGIYKLEFRSGNTYIGKSVDVNERFKDHMRSFEKKKAAAKMQAEYDRWGAPEMTVIIEAHPDHIDILERYFIGAMKPELNTQLPNELEVMATDSVVAYFDLLKHSTVDIIRLCASQDKEMDQLKIENERLEAHCSKLSDMFTQKVYETEAGEALQQAELQIAEVESQLEHMEDQLTAALKQIEELKKPWYKKFFA